MFGAAYKTGCIGSERDPAVHARKKRNLTAAFSAKALAGQESIVQNCLDNFVDKLGPLSRKSEGKGINVVHWVEMAIFDILGEMAFGEGFGCIEKGNVLHRALNCSLLHYANCDHLTACANWHRLNRGVSPLDGSDSQASVRGHPRRQPAEDLGSRCAREMVPPITDLGRPGETLHLQP